MDLTIKIREQKGKGPASRARRENRIPGVLYGRGYTSQMVEVDSRALQKALLLGAGDARLIELKVESKSGENAAEKALIKAIQRHPVTERIEHVDFYRVVMTEKIEVNVSLVLTGVPIGIKKGGVLEKRLDSIRVRCLPANIPDHFSIDVAALDLGDNFHVSALSAPEGVTILTGADQVIAVVTEVKIVEEAAPVAAAAAEGAAAEGAAPAAAGAAAPAAGAAAGAKGAKPAEGDKKEGAKEKGKG